MYNPKFKDLIVYEIYPTSFYDSNNDGIGDLKGIELKLPYIKELGFNGIWINPFFKSPFHDGGYDISNFKDVDPKFGTLNDFKSLIKTAHSLGIKIFVDCVAGHASEENPLFVKSGEETRNEYSDLFIWTDNVWNYNPKYKLISGRHPRNGNYLVNFFSFQPAFNYGFKDVDDPTWQMSYKDPRTLQARDYMVEVMLFWLGLGADGFRVDMADSLVKNDDDKSATIEVWQYMFAKVKKEYPDAFFVSEWSNPKQSLKAGFDCDFVLDHWDNFYHRFIRSTDFSRGPSVLNGASVDFFIKDLLDRYTVSIEEGGYLGIISGNHDGCRIANYATIDQLKIFYMFQFMLPGIPFVYYGDEIGMHFVDLPNKDGGYQRVGCRTPMQWDHSFNDGFSKADSSKLYLPINTASNITLEDNLNDSQSLYYFIKKLIDMRKTYPSIQDKKMTLNENDRIITISRNELTLVINLSDKNINHICKPLLATKVNNELPPMSSAVYINNK